MSGQILNPIYFTPRITDYSYKACSDIEKLLITQNLPQITKELTDLYNYQKSQWSVFPMTNWQSHRLMLQSCIAFELMDKKMVDEIHGKLLQWIKDSDCNCCDSNSQDYHWRCSINYLVYGLLAWVRAINYIKPFTKYNYKKEIAHIMLWLDPYLKGKKSNIEFIGSKIPSDINKKEYGKPFDPKYADNLVKLYNQL
jgi:hypothetical protein